MGGVFNDFPELTRNPSFGTIQSREGTVYAVKRPTDWSDLIRMITGEEIGIYREFGSAWSQDMDEWVCATFSNRTKSYSLFNGRIAGFSRLPIPIVWDSSVLQNYFDKYVKLVQTWPQQEIIHLCVEKDLQKLIPMSILSSTFRVGQNIRNIHGDFNGWIKLREKLPVTPRDILLTTNLELRRNLMDVLGAEQFMLRVKHQILDVRHMDDGTEKWDDYLVSFNVRDGGAQLTMLFVKDSSTPRRYLIRVPATLAEARLRNGQLVGKRWTVDAAVAWTFDLTVDEYKPTKET